MIVSFQRIDCKYTIAVKFSPEEVQTVRNVAKFAPGEPAFQAASQIRHLKKLNKIDAYLCYTKMHLMGLFN
jgi:hypothetical protein